MSNFSNFSTAQIQTGSQVRKARAALNPAALTRAQACRVIAQSSDPELIKSFARHGSKAVRRYVTHKVGVLLSPPKPDLSRFNVRTWTPEMAKEVLAIMAQHKLSAEAAAQEIGCTPRRIKDWQKKVA
jgi:hypothetical protein